MSNPVANMAEYRGRRRLRAEAEAEARRQHPSSYEPICVCRDCRPGDHPRPEMTRDE